jgi:hypothetical protein
MCQTIAGRIAIPLPWWCFVPARSRNCTCPLEARHQLVPWISIATSKGLGEADLHSW